MAQLLVNMVTSCMKLRIRWGSFTNTVDRIVMIMSLFTGTILKAVSTGTSRVRKVNLSVFRQLNFVQYVGQF